MPHRVPVSVIIPVYNAASRLPQLVAALQALSPQPEEIILVDDGSSDDTYRLLQALRLDTPVVAISQSNKGPAAARNAGVFRASSPFLAFTDDDCIPSPGWLGAYYQAAAAEPNFEVAFGAVVATGRKRYLSHYVENAGEGHQTANAFYRRETVVRLGGFDERFLTPYLEDTDLYLRVQPLGRELFVSEALVEHPIRPTSALRKVMRMKIHRNDFLLYRKHAAVYRRRHRGAGPAWYLLYYFGLKHWVAMLWKHRGLLYSDPLEWLTMLATLTAERIFLTWLVLRWTLIEKLG